MLKIFSPKTVITISRCIRYSASDLEYCLFCIEQRGYVSPYDIYTLHDAGIRILGESDKKSLDEGSSRSISHLLPSIAELSDILDEMVAEGGLYFHVRTSRDDFSDAVDDFKLAVKSSLPFIFKKGP